MQVHSAPFEEVSATKLHGDYTQEIASNIDGNAGNLFHESMKRMGSNLCTCGVENERGRTVCKPCEK